MATTFKELKVFVVDELPVGANILPFAIYIFKDPTKKSAGIYKSSIDGSQITPVDSFDELVGRLFHIGEDTPAEDSDAMFWYRGNELYNKVVFSDDVAWMRVGGSEWYFGSVPPVSTLGVDGDIFLKTNGHILRRVAGEWVASGTTIRPGILTIDFEDVPDLEAIFSENEDVLLIRGKGIYTHKVDAADVADGKTCLVSANGRWKLEAVSVEAIDWIVGALVEDAIDGQTNETGTALESLIKKEVDKRIIRGFFRPAVATINNWSFTVSVPGVKVGWGCIVTPNHPVFNSFTVSAWIETDGELTVKVGHNSGVASNITADWSYLIFSNTP